MFGWTSSEIWFYGGLTVMICAAVLGLVSIVIFCLTGRRLKKKLEEEYGKISR